MRSGHPCLAARPTAALLTCVALVGCGGGGGDGPTPAMDAPTQGVVAAQAVLAPAPAPAQSPVPTPTNEAAPGVCRKAPVAPRQTVPAIGQGVPSAQAHVEGMWSPLFDWPLIPVHVALTPDGRVMSYGTTRLGQQTGRFDYAVWDPRDGTGADAFLTLPNTTSTDMFCSGQLMMPQDGRLFVAGGDRYVDGRTLNIGTNESAIYDPRTRTLTQGPTLLRPRWYGTPAMLGNGEILLIGGLGDRNGPLLSQYPEVRRPDGGGRLLSKVDTSVLNYWYPTAFPTADGRVFGFDLDGRAYHIDTAGEGRLSPVGSVGLRWIGTTASVAAYAPGKLLVAGGGTTDAVTVDYGGPLPIVRYTAPMSAVRHYATLTVLPTGDVLATGGSGADNQLVDVVDPVEIWSPATGRWTIGAPGAIARLYHSVAMLMPDGSVLVGGGGAPGPLTNLNAERYFPPYLFESGGRWASRPAITGAPDVLAPGDTLAVDVDSARPIRRLTLVKTGSVTHSMNFDQRFLDLPFSVSGTRLTATLPRNAAELSPGFWMVFAIDDRGVPSVAPIMRITVPAVPQVDSGWTPSIGGVLSGAGTRFAASCAAGEVMAGVRGTVGASGSATVVRSVRPLCVSTDAVGRWVGVPLPRGTVAGIDTGPAFERACPANHAVVGLEGRAGDALDTLRIDCAPLDSARTVRSPVVRLDAVGGAGGVEHPPVACGENKASSGLYGLHTTLVASLGLVCGAEVVDPRTVPATAPVLPEPPATGASEPEPPTVPSTGPGAAPGC